MGPEPRLCAIPAGRKAVIAFVVDDDAGEALIYASPMAARIGLCAAAHVAGDKVAAR